MAGGVRGALSPEREWSRGDRAKAAELGADAFVPKPFNVDDLIGVLHELEQAS